MRPLALSVSMPSAPEAKHWRLSPSSRSGTASEFGLKVRTGPGEETLIGYNVMAGELFVDRTKSGQVDFSNLDSQAGKPLR